MTAGIITLSYVTTLLISIFLAVGVTSLLYWINDRTISPFVVHHRKGIIRTAGLIYLGILYVLQDMQYRVDPQMTVFGWHWAFLNLMLISLYVIAVEIGDGITVLVQAVCCAFYLIHYAQPSLRVLFVYILWVVVLGLLLATRQHLKKSRWARYSAMILLGLSGIIGIYVTRPRVFDLWWWVRDLSAFIILGVIIGEYTRLMHHTDAQTAELQSMTAYDRLARSKIFTDNQKDIANMLTEAHQKRVPLSIAAVDVDRFNEFNQHFGYQAGNIALVDVADCIRQVIVKSGVFARLYRSSGEEFTIGILGETEDRAAALISDCLKQVQNQHFAVGGQPVSLTLSAGITTNTESDFSIDDIYKRADDQLRVSKKNGRNQLSGSGVAMDGHQVIAVPRRTYFAQPIEHTDHDCVTPWGAELLLREFDATTNRWVLPDRFDISVEQQVALMTDLVSRSNIKRLTVNLTFSQFSDTNTATALAGFATSAYGPQSLIVETTTVPDLDTIRRVTALYREAGIKIYIDDVGSDNSYELVQGIFPYIDGVKFAIQNLRKQEPLARIQKRVAFWTRVAQGHAIDFILEGVETKEDVTFAQQLGVDHFQGYYYG